jgi:alpha-L-fucosidase 2
MCKNNNLRNYKPKARLVTVFFIQLLVFYVFAGQPPLKLWYNTPAVNWMTSALPIGNGVFGGMFFGGVSQEHLQFNDKTLWTGSTAVRGAYQNFGDLYLNFTSHTAYSDYKRELNLDEAIGRVSYKSGGVQYLREYFASYPDSAIVMRITTPDQRGKLTFTVNLMNAHTGTITYSGNKITMSGSVTIISYEAQVIVLNEGGTLSTGASQIAVSDADAVTIILTGATNYNPSSDTYIGETTTALHKRITNRISSASVKSYNNLVTAHRNDYQPLFNRVKLDINGITEPNVTTDELIRSYKDNPYLDILYYQYGRYLMLGSSRGILLPSNLQGLWNDSNSPAWQCDIHSNINIQMNYWPAENANLSECHLPFTDYVVTEALKPNGSWTSMAKSLGCKGWTLKTQNNIFAYSDWNWNRPANAWYCMHLWQHFAYTNDTTYLKNKAFPAMKSACEFWFSRLKADSYGKLIAPDEWSPEQGTWEDNVAYAQQLIWELFDNTLKAALIVSSDQAFIDTLSIKFSKLDNGLKIGSWGQIKEWTTQGDLQGNTHRHLSHLIALYPGNQISYHRDSTFVKAAIVTLNSRGDGGTGWSRAWKISCWARLFDGDHAYKLMKAAQNLTTFTSVSMTDGLGGVYENLLDAHPSFQIDGNFGFTAGVTEMLIQSNQGFIQLLPALPSVWPNGSYTGLKAIGNFTINLEWKNALPSKAVILSGSGDSCRIYYPSIRVISLVDNNGNNIPFIKRNNNLIVFATSPGKKYTLLFDNDVVKTAGQ